MELLKVMRLPAIKYFSGLMLAAVLMNYVQADTLQEILSRGYLRCGITESGRVSVLSTTTENVQV